MPGARPTPEQTLALYDGEIRYADHHLGAVVETLKRRQLYDSTWILVTADHGDLFGEHGVTAHGNVPYQEVLHVPLVLARLGLPRPDGIQGGIPPRLGRPLIAEPARRALRALLSGAHPPARVPIALGG